MLDMPFKPTYANFYDLLYFDKDYLGECTYIAALAKELRKDLPVSRILDFGCGTGNHSLILAKMGYEVTGVDISDAMRNQAISKATHSGLSIRFLKDIPVNESFDLIISLFDCINYLPSTSSLISTLRKLCESLSPSAHLIIETWNGTAVPYLVEKKKQKRVIQDAKSYLRKTEIDLDWGQQILSVHFTLLDENEQTVLTQETHPMRYYTIAQMNEIANAAGLSVMNIFTAYLRNQPSMDDFKLIYVMKRLN